ncbi:hypothetical protein [Vibrio diazotrophicus]|uniref:hypothetical protein n=1 Tax=Vibrio diazotrophicus TaxID=685 RepID=UPI000C9E2AD5|nr:hypothetical protein [Vibrio diazotrophicus]PNH81335.1 hypothetical protein C1N27_07265 [Vibrio diazotrophicus]
MGMILDRKKSGAFAKINTLQRRLKESHNKSWEVGVFRESGTHSSGWNYAALATYLHNGSAKDNLPPRPFLDITFMWSGKHYNKLIRDALSKYLLSEKEVKLETLISRIASMQCQDVKDTFGQPSKLVSNKPSTIKQKGSDKPLVDRGELRDHIAMKLSWSGSIQYS